MRRSPLSQARTQPKRTPILLPFLSNPWKGQFKLLLSIASSAVRYNWNVYVNKHFYLTSLTASLCSKDFIVSRWIKQKRIYLVNIYNVILRFPRKKEINLFFLRNKTLLVKELLFDVKKTSNMYPSKKNRVSFLRSSFLREMAIKKGFFMLLFVSEGLMMFLVFLNFSRV